MTDQGTPQAAMSVTAKSSAVKAGWICLVLGFLTFWIFGFGFIFSPPLSSWRLLPCAPTV